MQRPICIVGAGYRGVATMIGLAELNSDVIAYDDVPDRLRRLQLGFVPFREPGVDDLLRKHVKSGRIAFADSLEQAARDTELVVIAVSTSSRGDSSIDVSGLFSTVEALRSFRLDTWPTIVIRSTVPPGTSDQLAKLVDGWGELIIAPDFLREGSAVHDFLTFDRIVVGCNSAAAAVPYVSLFESLQKPVVFTSRSNAELIKCGSSAFLALKMSFAKEIANLCDALGATSDDVLRGIGYDQRIGSDFLNAGIGLGGQSFEKDVKSIEHVADKYNVRSDLCSATLRVNEAQQSHIVNLIEEAVGSVSGLTFGVWGLTFEASTDIARDAIARIIVALSERGATITAYDPDVHVATLPRGSRLATTALEAARADVLLVLTQRPEFYEIAPHSYAASITRRMVIDCRNALDAERVAAAGLTYCGPGRALARSEHIQAQLLASAL